MKEKAKREQLNVTKKFVESNRTVKVAKERRQYEKGKGIAKRKSTTIIEGQRDSEGGEVGKEGRRDSMTQEERAEKNKDGGQEMLR